MYYEERVINGVLHYRTSPDDDFQPYTLEELTRRYTVQKRKYKATKDNCKAMRASIEQVLSLLADASAAM